MATREIEWGRRASGSERLALSVTALGAVGVAALAIGNGGASARAPAPIPAPRVERGDAAPRHVLAAPAPAPPAAHATGMVPLRRFTAAVGADLSESLRRAGVPDPVAGDYVGQMMRVERFAAEISVADRFDLVVLELAGAAPTLVYAGMDRVGRGDLMFLKYGDEQGRVEWVDARGLERRESAGMMLPVGGRVTSGFGSRMHPLLGYARFHRGLDLAAATGTPIHAAADGRVTRAGWHGGYGRQVALAHGGGLATSYGHMSRIAARAGETVRRGQVIGFAGSSGLSTGPHVHFEVMRNGRPIDPRSARIDMPVAMSAAQRQAFNGELRSVLMAAGARAFH